MRKIYTIAILAALFANQQAFATDSKDCSAIADACLSAGFVRTEPTDKAIWKDCMKPVILGKTVEGVTIDAKVAKTCRMDKIKDMKAELKELQKAG